VQRGVKLAMKTAPAQWVAVPCIQGKMVCTCCGDVVDCRAATKPKTNAPNYSHPKANKSPAKPNNSPANTDRSGSTRH
jgi:hypothetical protein